MTYPNADPGETLPQPERIVSPAGEVIALRFDVHHMLEEAVGHNWQETISDVILAGSQKLRDADGHYTNREEGFSGKLSLITGDPNQLAEKALGLWDLYKGRFRELMQLALPEGVEPLRTYDSPADALEGLAQKPTDSPGGKDVQYRMEGHTDMRWTGVLVVDFPPNEHGGDLVISNKAEAKGIAEIEQDATHIKHIPGTLLCFTQGRRYPHFTQEITGGRRVIVSLNYPLASETEEMTRQMHIYINSKGV